MSTPQPEMSGQPATSTPQPAMSGQPEMGGAVAVQGPTRAARALREEHDHLEELAERVLAGITDCDREDIAATIQKLQATVLAHLEGEERDVLPAYAEYAPDDAAAILEDHATMRRQLAELDIATDLHLVRVTEVRAFLEELKAHAKRENAGLYMWAVTSDTP